MQIDSRHDEKAIPVLVEGLSSKKVEEQKLAVSILGDLGPRAKDATRELIQLLDHPNSELRGGAVTTLGRIGPPAASAVEALIVVVENDPDYFVRCDAARALGQLGGAAKRAVPVLKKELNDGGSLSQIATEAIRRIER